MNRLALLAAAFPIALLTASVAQPPSGASFPGGAAASSFPGFRCKMGRSWSHMLYWDQCEGVLTHALSETRGRQRAAQRIQSLTWNSRSDTVRRSVTVAGDSVQRVVRSIVAPEEYALAELVGRRDRAFVIGKVSVDASGKPDKRYGVGGPGYEGFGADFYFVVDSVGFPNITIPEAESRPIGRWRLYGIKNGELTATKVRGLLHECRHRHQGKKREIGASFLTCTTADSLTSILDKTRLLDRFPGQSLFAVLQRVTSATATPAARMVALQQWSASLRIPNLVPSDLVILSKALQEGFDAPFWTACGIGCCTAEF